MNYEMKDLDNALENLYELVDVGLKVHSEYTRTEVACIKKLLEILDETVSTVKWITKKG